PTNSNDARELIRAAPADRIGYGAAGASEFRADPCALQIHLSDIQLVHLGAQLAERRVCDVGAVDQVRVVLAIPASCQANDASIIWNAWNELKQSAVGSLERKRVERAGVEVEADLGRSGIDDRRRGEDGQALRDGEAYDEIDLSIFPQLDAGGAP